jgi:hypothetical protein
MSAMDLALIFLIIGAAAAWLLRFALLRFALGRRLPANLMRWPALLAVVLVTATTAYVLLVDRAESIQRAVPGSEVTLFGRVIEVALAEDTQHASVYLLEDPTGRIEVATENFPPQPGSLACVRGRVEVYDGRRIVFSSKRISTF